MKIGELRDKMKQLEKEELQTLIVEMYKLIPKRVKEDTGIDRLIDHPHQFKAAKKTSQSVEQTVDFDMLRSEVELFIKNAYEQNYIAPNRIIAKKERSNWRFTAKRLVDQVTAFASQSNYEQQCAVLLEKLYILFCYASGHYVFTSEEPFRALKIPQEAFLNRVISLKKKVDQPNKWIREALLLIIDNGVDRETLTSTLLTTMIEHLTNAPLKEQAIRICEELIQVQLSKPTPTKRTFIFQVDFHRDRKIEYLVEMVFMIQSALGEYVEAVNYYEQQYPEQSDKEIKLYIELSLIKRYQRLQDWLNVYERAVENGIVPRDSLQRMYQYIKETNQFPEYMY